MEHEYTYYIVEGDGPAKAAIDQYSKESLAFMDHVRAIGDKYGVEQIFQGRNGIIGLLFENKEDVPEGLMHKKDHPDNVYSPNKRSKAGKVIAKEFAAVHRPDIHTISRIAKTNPVMVQDPRGRTGLAMLWPTYEVVGKVCVWKVPVDQSDRGYTGRAPAMEDFTGLREIKKSEYWAMKEAAKDRTDQ
jgi:hypothetical protein